MTHLLDSRRPRLLLAVFCLVLWLPGFFALPPMDRDESRFAQATKQMLETGDYVDIRNGTEARNRKPIGIYWLQVPGAALARADGIASGNPIWPYRLPSLLGGFVAVLATHSIGALLVGRRAGLVAGAMLAASVALAVEAATAKTDAALLGATTLAMGVLARAWAGARVDRWRAAVFWVAMGLGILLKGPITPMVAGLTVAALIVSSRRARWLADLRWRWGVPLMLAIVLPWFVAIGIATHGRFFSDALGGDLAGKLAGGEDAHGAPPGYHFLLLSLTLFPAAPAILAALPGAWRTRRDAASRFLLSWIVPSWVVFEAVPTKLPHYPLPLFPALCVLGAAWLTGPAPEMAPGWWRRLATGLGLAVAIGLAITAAALPIVVDRAPSLLGAPGLLAAGGVAWLMARPAGRLPRRPGEGPRPAMPTTLSAIVAMPLVTWAVLGFELPRMASVWPSTRTCAAVARHGAPGGFAAAGFAEPSLMFLCGTGTRLLAGGDAAAAFLAAAPGRVVAVESRDRPQFLAAPIWGGEPPPAPFVEIRGVNYSNGRRVDLSLFASPAAPPPTPATP